MQVDLDVPADAVLAIRGAVKRFGAVTAVDDVTFAVRPGEVLALVGENGAGKSTLMKLLTGVHQPDAGTLEVAGTATSFAHPLEARDRGIAIIHQELALLEHRTVAQNVFLGREPTSTFGRVDRARMHAGTAEVLARLHVDDVVRPDQRVSELSVARRQMVEIAKAVSTDARVLVMDEPTAALSPAESETLFTLVDQLRERGVGVVYISHRLDEVFRLADRLVVLRDGAVVARWDDLGGVGEDDVVAAMVGRSLDAYYPDPARPEDLGAERLVVQDAANAVVGPLDLAVRAGEVVGIGGLEGAGQRQLADALFGLAPFTTGRMLVDGHAVTPRRPRQAVAAGLGYVTADRKGEGLVLDLPVAVNATLTAEAVGRRPGPTDVAERLAALDVRMRDAAQRVGDLSGGNQQKVVLARWLLAEVGVLVLHEPTRGIDVGSKAAIHDLMRDLARAGMAVVMISSDLPELLGVSDRLLVMRGGRIAGELPRGVGEQELMRVATGVDEREVAA